MSAATIGGASALGNVTGQANNSDSSNPFGSINSQDFVKILLSELSNQDPFKPQDSGALLEQLSNIRNIEGQMGLQDKLSALVLQNQVSAAGTFLGRMVQGLDALNNEVKGLVTSVRVEDDKVFLELDTGKALQMDRVVEVAPAEGS